MDFHSLARKELQSLCKKNKIPANMTNVAMADALKALEKVEGLDELINDAPRSDPHESPEKTTNAEPRTAGRTSTRRKPTKVEPESSQSLTRTRRATRITVAEGAEVYKNVNLPETPAMPASRRRAPAASARQKIDSQLMESWEDEKSEVTETPALKSSRRKAPAVSTKKKIEPLKSEQSVQRVYGTRQSVRLLEKTMAGLSLKETRRVEAVKIEGLGEETEEIEQEKNVPAGDSEVLSCQDINETLGESELKHEIQEDKSNGHEVNESESEVVTCQDILAESELKHEVQGDNKSNGHEVNESESEVLTRQDINEIIGESELKHQAQGDNLSNGHEVNELESDVLSCQYLDESQENANKTKNEVQDDNKTNDHEMEDESGVLVQNFDRLLGTESEVKDELHEGRKSADCEGDSDVRFQDKDQLLDNGSETKLEFQEDEDRNDHELVVCNAKLEMVSEPCTDLDNYLNANDEDDNDSSDESFCLKESSVKTIDVKHESINDNGLVAVIEHHEMLNASVKPETEAEVNGNRDSLIVEASDNNSACETEDTSVEVMNYLNPKIPEVVDKGSEMDSMEDDHDDDLPSNADIEEDSDVNDIEEESSDGSELDELSDELDETSDDSESDEVSDASFTIEVQESENTEEIQKAPLILEADCEKSQSRKEKSKEADVININVVEAKESNSDKTPKSLKGSPFCPLVSDTENAGEIAAVSAYECIQTFETTPLKQICDKVTVGMVSSPFAANTIQGQFPRPTESTPRKSSTKKLTTNQKIIHPDIINKENIDSSGRKVEPKKDKMKKENAADKLREKSLRELSKMLKETLEITSKKNNESKNVSKVGTTRPALQKLPENCTARAEAENEKTENA